MKELKNYIENNRETFDDKEPSIGHFDRFEALLDQNRGKGEEKKKTKRVQLRYIISVAASIAILVAVSTQLYSPDSDLPINMDEQGIEMDVSEEFRTTNNFYNEQIDIQIANIMCKLAQTDTENQHRLTLDLQRIIEENKQFVKDIADDENEALAIHYLVKHYKANIQALENIDEKLGKYVEC